MMDQNEALPELADKLLVAFQRQRLGLLFQGDR